MNTIPLDHSSVPPLGFAVLVNGAIIQLGALVRDLTWFLPLLPSPPLIQHIIILILTPKCTSNQYQQIFPRGILPRVSQTVFLPSNTALSHCGLWVTRPCGWLVKRPQWTPQARKSETPHLVGTHLCDPISPPPHAITTFQWHCSFTSQTHQLLCIPSCPQRKV